MLELFRTTLNPDANDLSVRVDAVTYAKPEEDGYSLLYQYEMLW